MIVDDNSDMYLYIMQHCLSVRTVDAYSGLVQGFTKLQPCFAFSRPFARFAYDNWLCKI